MLAVAAALVGIAAGRAARSAKTHDHAARPAAPDRLRHLQGNIAT